VDPLLDGLASAAISASKLFAEEGASFDTTGAGVPLATSFFSSAAGGLVDTD
jgi:hypothetical protein